MLKSTLLRFKKMQCCLQLQQPNMFCMLHILTCSLLFLFELLLQLLVFRLCVKVIVAVLRELPFVGLVH